MYRLLVIFLSFFLSLLNNEKRVWEWLVMGKKNDFHMVFKFKNRVGSIGFRFKSKWVALSGLQILYNPYPIFSGPS